MKSSTRARLELLATAALFSTGGAGIKATAMTSWQMASWRGLVAACAIAAMTRAARGAWSRRTVLVSLAYAGATVSYVLANKLTTAANAVFLQSTAPFYLLLLGPWLLREPLVRRDLVFMAFIAVGMACMLGGAQAASATAPDPFLGNLVAVFSGVCWALTVLGLRWMGREGGGRASSQTAVVGGNLLAFLIALPLSLQGPTPSRHDVVIVLLLGAFQVALAYLFLTQGVTRVRALEASLLLFMEPVLNPVWAYLFHGEIPGRLPLLGCAVILVGSIWNTAQASLGARRLPKDPVDPAPV